MITSKQIEGYSKAHKCQAIKYGNLQTAKGGDEHNRNDLNYMTASFQKFEHTHTNKNHAQFIDK